MEYFADSFAAAFALLLQLDPQIMRIIVTSVYISLTASVIAALLAIPAGVAMALNRFKGKATIQHLLNTLMAMPTVVIGLLLYGLFSRAGPLGDWGLLYTPTAIIIAQAILIFPIMMNLTVTAVNSADPRLIPTLKSLGARTLPMMLQVIRTTRFAILAGVITGFGRAIGEVGAAMMLGGNIEGFTRTMTTAIALETSKGEFELGLALGMVLLLIAFVLNFLLSILNKAKS
ncbi:ABC transporter permease [Methylophaga sp. OBS1]|jgi:tungstate transport system permease protein|uniref:ABC transporter permease n=1 Tax=Methylophaga sp. OBS1 TaxID=2991933 RepID=UPI00225755A7|nr:ABC transporter permease [Methylophaga sp. OBS1]MCX4193542.1 ABC transporter permease [Methylophaga sp. OBS1]